LIVSSTIIELRAKEHSLNLHDGFPKPECAACCAQPSKLVTSDGAGPPSPVADHDLPDLPASTGRKPPGNLAAIFARWKSRLVIEPDDASFDSLDLAVSSVDSGAWCDTCQGRRVVRRDLPFSDPDFGKAIPCPTCSKGIFLQRRLDRLFGELPDRLKGHSLDNFLVDLPIRRQMISRVREWLSTAKNHWLYLHGPVGRGKSHLAVGALKAWIELGHSGTFKLSRDLLDRIRAGYDDGSYRDLMRSLVDVELLVLDDLGSERHKANTDDDWASEKIFQIIGGRYDANVRTIVTANFNLDELSKRLGNPRVSSRIFEMASERFVLDLSKLPDQRQLIGGKSSV